MISEPYYIHPTSLVETTSIGDSTNIWAFVHILKEVRIGSNCNICDHCFIEDDVIIGNNVTIKSGVYLWSGITIENNVFIGPNVVFTNDIRPRSKNKNYKAEPTKINEGASIGANSTVLAGITIGKYSMSGIGAVITRDIKDFSLVYGNPARHHGWVDETGEKLVEAGIGHWCSIDGKRSYRETPSGLKPEHEITLINI